MNALTEPTLDDTTRCPRCEGYAMTYHTYRGECSADPNCPHGIPADTYCRECDYDAAMDLDA